MLDVRLGDFARRALLRNLPRYPNVTKICIRLFSVLWVPFSIFWLKLLKHRRGALAFLHPHRLHQSRLRIVDAVSVPSSLTEVEKSHPSSKPEPLLARSLGLTLEPVTNSIVTYFDKLIDWIVTLTRLEFRGKLSIERHTIVKTLFIFIQILQQLCVFLRLQKIW